MRVRLFRSTLPLLVATAAGCGYNYGTSSAPPPPPPPGVETAQVAFCPGFAPGWVAFQDGDGAWTRAQPATVGGNPTFQADFHSGRGAVATLSLTADIANPTVLSVFYGTPAELATQGNAGPGLCVEAVSKELLGTVAGLGDGESAVVGGGFFSNARTGAGDENGFELQALPAGPHDLVASRTTQVNGGPAVTSLILRRDVDVPDGATVPVLDFASAEAFAPVPATLTIQNMGEEGASAGLRLITANSNLLVAPVLGGAHDFTRAYPALPENRMRPGDLLLLSAGSAVAGAGRTAQIYFRAPTDRILTLPDALVPPTIEMAATAPLLRPRARFGPQGDFNRLTSMNYQQGVGTIVSVSMTSAYAARNAGGYDLIMPDFSGVPGFDPAWGLQPNRALQWTANRVGGTLGLGVTAIPVDGTARQTASVTGTIP